MALLCNCEKHMITNGDAYTQFAINDLPCQ